MLTTLSFGDEAPYCLDWEPVTVRSNGVWAVSRNKHGRLEYEPCTDRQDAEEFIRDVLDGNGVVMTDDELARELNMRDEDYVNWEVYA